VSSDYFSRLHRETPTRFWVNNPSGEEMDRAIAAGAINCTTNPAYCSKLMVSDPAYLHGIIDDTLKETRDIEKAAVLVYQRAAKRVMDRFQPLYEQSDGECGYVTIQDDPREDQDTEAVVRGVLSNRHLGPNYMAKIPVISGGMEAIEACVAKNVPICATEVFAVAQAIEVCELYERAVTRTGNRPPFFLTHITGIFDEYLAKVVRREQIEIAPQILAQAGCAIARKEYRLIKERGYQTTLLGGGARGTQHFTEMVGGDVHVTINWSTAQEIIDSDPPLVSRIEAEAPQSAIDELAERLPDFRRAYEEDGLSAEEYAEFGPVQLFRNAFLKGWYLLLAEVASRRQFHAL
jgi:transaldolase